MHEDDVVINRNTVITEEGDEVELMLNERRVSVAVSGKLYQLLRKITEQDIGLKDLLTTDNAQLKEIASLLYFYDILFPEPACVEEHAGDISAVDFFRSMGNLLGGTEPVLYTSQDVLPDEGNSYIRFTYKENVLELTKEVFHHIFERRSLNNFSARPDADRKDVINLILSFYKTGIPVEIGAAPVEIKGTS
ncbi:hypothetical protein M8R21_47465 [Klebsiella sp. T2.Ur]|nr:hypothetical protein [Klebsiella sp. T2.Ur]